MTKSSARHGARHEARLLGREVERWQGERLEKTGRRVGHGYLLSFPRCDRPPTRAASRIVRAAPEDDPPFGAGVRLPPVRGCRAPGSKRSGMAHLRLLVLLALLGLVAAGGARA